MKLWKGNTAFHPCVLSGREEKTGRIDTLFICALQSAGKPTQIDPLPPNQTAPQYHFKLTPLIPAQTDPLKRGERT
ncbi:hypothetical protein, partial [Ferruginibacter sp.]|uniref:hypothetical protein n=1 Tax=Ferruginibacter sp. TaxID=1940288 RepID=UPI00265828B6